jgi:hypothetical protein
MVRLLLWGSAQGVGVATHGRCGRGVFYSGMVNNAHHVSGTIINAHHLIPPLPYRLASGIT